MSAVLSKAHFSNGSKVLLVDDDRWIVEVFTEVLSQDGYQIFPAYDGEIALEIIAREKPDVVVLDVLLPDRDGIEICRQVKHDPNTQFTPVILVTGITSRDRRLDGLRSGADDFLDKPVDPYELTARVRSLIRTKRLHDAVESHRQELEQRVAERTQELQQAYEQLKEISQVKDNIMRIVVHELRTPLQQGMRALDIITEEGIDATAKKDAERHLRDAFDWLEYHVGNMQVFSDPSKLKMAANSLAVLVESAIQQVDRRLKRNVEHILVDVPNHGLPPVFVDRQAISRALAQVIDNAVKFGEGKPITINAVRHRDTIRLAIRDRGGGIADHVKPHLFKTLYQGDSSPTRQHEGMGIGLALVKMILDEHGAAIEIESRLGEGTCVSIDLPIAAGYADP
jgi:two-component system sensor histidine kinase/response regulator